jgi:hypothetical protein
MIRAERRPTGRKRRTQVPRRTEVALDRTDDETEREQQIVDAHVRRLTGDLLTHERPHAFDRGNLGGILPREVRSDIERPLECLVEGLEEQRPIELVSV